MQGYSAKYEYKHTVLASAAWLKDNIAFTFTLDDVSLSAAHFECTVRGYAAVPFAANSASISNMLPCVEASDLPVQECVQHFSLDGPPLSIPVHE